MLSAFVGPLETSWRWADGDSGLCILVRSRSGWSAARLGDWILKASSGEVWCCESESFSALYEPATSPAQTSRDPR